MSNMSSLYKNRFSITKSTIRYLLKILLLAVIYHLAARVGLEMAYVQINTSPVWPPTGIALAALLIFGGELWPGITLGVLLGSIFTGAPFKLALGMALGNTLEALCGFLLLKHIVDFHNAIDRTQDVLGLLLASIFSSAISASIGTTTLMIFNADVVQRLGAIWLTWWIGDLLGALVVAPLLLVWVSASPFRIGKRVYLEEGIMLMLLAMVTWYVFCNRPTAGILHQALIYVIIPFSIWAALRLGQRGAASAAFLVSGITIWGTVQGMGPFALESKNDSLVLLQTFLAVVSLTSLILAAATIERRKATEALHQQANDLMTLNESSKTLLDNSDVASIYHTILQLAVTRLGVDAAWIEIYHQAPTESGPAASCGIPLEMVSRLRTIWENESHDTSQNSPLVKTSDDLPSAPDVVNSSYRSYAAFPLIFSNKSIGVLKLLSKDKSFFSKDRQLLIQSFTNLAAVATQNTWLFGEVRKSNKQLHALTQRLMKAQEEERLHLSRELHDESGQLLAGLLVQLGLLERDADLPEGVHERVAELKRTTNAIQDNLHALAVNLRPASLDHLGLVTALRQYVNEFSQQYDIDVEFEAVGMQQERLPIEMETSLFRIVQETLTNVVLHAQATHVDVLISQCNDHIVTTVEDNGIGFIPTSLTIEEHLGLFGMRERIEMLGGKFTIESSPGKGTTVNVKVPSDA